MRALAGIGAVLVLSVAASGCVGGSPAPAATPDPFAGLADRSDQAFREGLELYGQGQYRDALTSFERARINSPSADPRIAQMIERSRAALAPTATPVPPTATPVPVPPTATPVAMSIQSPDTELGRRYFGEVSLAVVPTREMDSSATNQFFYQDQIGLRIEGLKQRLRLPYSLRVFNLDTSTLVAEVQSEDAATTAASQAATRTTSGTSNGLSLSNGLRSSLVGATTSTPTAAEATSTAAPASDIKLSYFWDTYVWYHQGGEAPGRYRLELYASGLLTNTFDYTVGTVPVPTPEPTLAPTLAPVNLPSVQAEPVSSFVPAPVVSVDRARATQPAPVAAAPIAPTATPAPTVAPSPTPIPTPATVSSAQVGGVPAGLDVDEALGRFYIADASGVIWSSDDANGQQRPTLGTPFHIKGSPVDLATDASTHRLFVAARNCPRDGGAVDKGCIVVVDGQSGATLKTMTLDAQPGDLRVDWLRGLIYVALPDLNKIVVLDGRAGTPMPDRTIDNVRQVTSMAVDPDRHMLYAVHLGGDMTIVDTATSRVVDRLPLTGVGLSGVATARGLAYAVNTATHQLAVVEPRSRGVIRYMLSDEPAAVAASEESGSVYVLGSRNQAIVRIDPTNGSEVGRVLLSGRSGHSGLTPADVLGLRPRLVINQSDETAFATVPEAGSLVAASNSTFPALAREIPRYDINADTLSSDQEAL